MTLEQRIEAECPECGEPNSDGDICAACEQRIGEDEAEREYHEQALADLDGGW